MLNYVAKQRKSIGNKKPIQGVYGVQNQGSGDMYSKFSFILHTIRSIIDNDDKFFELIKTTCEEVTVVDKTKVAGFSRGGFKAIIASSYLWRKIVKKIDDNDQFQNYTTGSSRRQTGIFNQGGSSMPSTFRMVFVMG